MKELIPWNDEHDLIQYLQQIRTISNNTFLFPELRACDVESKELLLPKKIQQHSIQLHVVYLQYIYTEIFLIFGGKSANGRIPEPTTGNQLNPIPNPVDVCYLMGQYLIHLKPSLMLFVTLTTVVKRLYLHQSWATCLNVRRKRTYLAPGVADYLSGPIYKKLQFFERITSCLQISRRETKRLILRYARRYTELKLSQHP